jgi:hypothetical protein
VTNDRHNTSAKHVHSALIGISLRGNQGTHRIAAAGARTARPPENADGRMDQSREAHHPAQRTTPRGGRRKGDLRPLVGLEPATCCLEEVSAPSDGAG